MVVNYRKLNTVTKKNTYLFLNTEDLQDMIKQVEYYTGLNL